MPDIPSIPSSQGSSGLVIITIPANEASVTQNFPLPSDSRPRQPGTIVATVVPSPFYTVGQENTDTVHVITRRVVVTKATLKFNLSIQLDGGAPTIDFATAEGAAVEGALEWTAGILATIAGEVAARATTSAFFGAVLKLMNALTPPSFVPGKLNNHVEAIRINSCELIVTYNVGDQGGEVTITGVGSNAVPYTNPHQGITWAHFINNHTQFDGDVEWLVKQAWAANASAAKGKLQQKYPGSEIIWEY